MTHITIGNFEMLRPQWEVSQHQILSWIADAHAKSEQLNRGWQEDDPLFLQFASEVKQRLFKLGMGKDKIQKRAYHHPDFSHQEWASMQIYPMLSSLRGAGVKERSVFFDKAARSIFAHFYPQEATPPDHLIHVTCTGYAAPSGAQHLVTARNWHEKTIVTHAYHMGCYASMPALRMASGFLRGAFNEAPARVDIVHTELCSLHLNPSIHSTDQLVIQSLFADGFIKYSLQLEDPHSGFNILALHEETIPDSASCMSWVCEDCCNHMTISKEVPVFIARTLPGFLSRLIKKTGLDLGVIQKEALFAIHPGGPKIIQHVARILNLEEWQIKDSRWVLENYGNMSSATLPHIWQRIWETNRHDAPFIVSLAYGPGLTVSGAVFAC